MNKLPYILLILTVISCATQNNTSTPTLYDVDDLGWVERILREAKIEENTIPTVYKSTDNGAGFTVELPCWEYDSDEYHTANVVIEHKRLDSALVKAKIQGLDDIYYKYAQCHTYHYENNELTLDSINYMVNFAGYMREAQFSCLCIKKTRNLYIVNATIRIPIRKMPKRR